MEIKNLLIASVISLLVGVGFALSARKQLEVMMIKQPLRYWAIAGTFALCVGVVAFIVGIIKNDEHVVVQNAGSSKPTTHSTYMYTPELPPPDSESELNNCPANMFKVNGICVRLADHSI